MTAESQTIEGTARVVSEEPAEERSLAVVPERQAHLASGLGAVAAMSDDAFAKNLELLRKAKVRAQEMQKALLTEGVDYGTVPGIPRPFLHKPGAETFEKAYGFATSYEIERKVGDGIKTPEVEYIVHAKVHLGDTDGPIVAEGVGSCNTHESKYRYRAAKRSCPSCGVEGLIKGRPDGKLKGAYWCPQDKGGCNSRFPVGSDEFKAIEEQTVGQVENENPWDLANTMLKMARKRAGVDGILTATGTSGLFTQDDDSPSVQRDAGGSASAGQGAATSGGQATSSAKAPVLPKIPQGITEETSLGDVELWGTIEVTDKTQTDGSMRQGKDGSHLGFRLAVPGGANVGQIVTRGPLAEKLATVSGADPKKLHGLAVELTGEMIARPWTNAAGEQMPPARRTEVRRIVTEDWVLDGTTEAPTVAAARAAADAGGGPKEVLEAAMAADAGQPGMTLDAFKKAAKAGKVALAYAEQVAKGRWPDAASLAALSDPQRLELAAELDLISPEED